MNSRRLRRCLEASVAVAGAAVLTGCEVVNTAAQLGMWDEASRRNDLYQQQIQQQRPQVTLPVHDTSEPLLKVYPSTWHYDGEIHSAYERACAHGNLGVYRGYFEFTGEAVHNLGPMWARIPFTSIQNIEGVDIFMGASTVTISASQRRFLFSLREKAKGVEQALRSYISSYPAAQTSSGEYPSNPDSVVRFQREVPNSQVDFENNVLTAPGAKVFGRRGDSPIYIFSTCNYTDDMDKNSILEFPREYKGFKEAFSQNEPLTILGLCSSTLSQLSLTITDSSGNFLLQERHQDAKGITFQAPWKFFKPGVYNVNMELGDKKNRMIFEIKDSP